MDFKAFAQDKLDESINGLSMQDKADEVTLEFDDPGNGIVQNIINSWDDYQRQRASDEEADDEQVNPLVGSDEVSSFSQRSDEESDNDISANTTSANDVDKNNVTVDSADDSAGADDDAEACNEDTGSEKEENGPDPADANEEQTS